MRKNSLFFVVFFFFVCYLNIYRGVVWGTTFSLPFQERQEISQLNCESMSCNLEMSTRTAQQKSSVGAEKRRDVRGTPMGPSRVRRGEHLTTMTLIPLKCPLGAQQRWHSQPTLVECQPLKNGPRITKQWHRLVLSNSQLNQW